MSQATQFASQPAVDPAHVLHSLPNQPILEIKNLRTHFFLERGIVRAVDGVNLRLDRQSTLGIVGESGCGKSVTAMSVMRLIKYPPGKIVGGEILLHRQDGKAPVDIAKLDAKGAEMRAIRGAEIAMIFQEPMTSLNPLQTIGSQIAETVILHQNVGKAAALQRAEEMLHRVHISAPGQRLREYPHQLSGGMRQRVMIAMALSCNPSILVADEPTTALDVTVQAQIIGLMQELQREFKSSIMMITHNLGVVSQMADHVAVMYMGKVVEYAEKRDLFHKPLHPYTVGLLNSVPVLGRKKDKLEPIKGMVPGAGEKIIGCAFAARCPHTMQICLEKEPPLGEIQPGHQAACWLHE
ncbi:MAG: ABC transporter ATP-binding protein [Chloroflexota bacterium]|nr:ABC transporter ATP-binding protein [Chloroflexota bacterium]